MGHAPAGVPAAATKAHVTPAKQAQPNLAVPAAAGLQVVEMLAPPLATDIRAVIDSTKQEVEAAAKAYYAAKVGTGCDWHRAALSERCFVGTAADKAYFVHNMVHRWILACC